VGWAQGGVSFFFFSVVGYIRFAVFGFVVHVHDYSLQ